MIDKTPNEMAALEHAGVMGGEYLESIGKFDLSSLKPEEYATFIESVVDGFYSKLTWLYDKDRQKLNATVPF
jgi:hypothetical protein